MTINTTRGAIPRPEERPGHTLNTSRVLEEDLVYEDEEPEILAVLPGVGYHAVVKGGDGERAVPLVAFVALDSGKMHGVAVGANGLIDLTENVEDLDGFVRYEQANTDDKENENG